MPGAATQVYSSDFDREFEKLSPVMQLRLQQKLDDMGRRLESFPHYRMSSVEAFRLRVGDYRVIYRFDLDKNEVYFGTMGIDGKSIVVRTNS